MAKLNISQAAKRVGVSRQTFYRHIEKKGISTTKDADGNPLIDLSELLRVYGELQGHDDKRNAPPRQRGTLSNDNPDRALQAEIDKLKQENGSLKERIERAELEADRWHTQAERLSLALAHFKPQSPPAPVVESSSSSPAPEPVPAPVDPAPEPETLALPENRAVQSVSIWGRLKTAFKA